MRKLLNLEMPKYFLSKGGTFNNQLILSVPSVCSHLLLITNLRVIVQSFNVGCHLLIDLEEFVLTKKFVLLL